MKCGVLAMVMAVASALGSQQIVPQVPEQDLPRVLPPMKLRGDFQGIELGRDRVDRGAAFVIDLPPWSPARMRGVVADPAVTALVRALEQQTSRNAMPQPRHFVMPRSPTNRFGSTF